VLRTGVIANKALTVGVKGQSPLKPNELHKLPFITAQMGLQLQFLFRTELHTKQNHFEGRGRVLWHHAVVYEFP